MTVCVCCYIKYQAVLLASTGKALAIFSMVLQALYVKIGHPKGCFHENDANLVEFINFFFKKATYNMKSYGKVRNNDSMAPKKMRQKTSNQKNECLGNSKCKQRTIVLSLSK